jgi:hypothetical protein
MKNLTFSRKGLTKIQIEFLTNIEAMFFKNENIDFEMLKKGIRSLKNYTSEQRVEMLEAWNYWEFIPKPLIRSSYKTEVVLDSLLLDGGLFWLRNGKKDKLVKPSTKLKRILGTTGLIYTLHPDNFYFEIITEVSGKKALYIKYQSIIGSRFIAYVK